MFFKRMVRDSNISPDDLLIYIVIRHVCSQMVQNLWLDVVDASKRSIDPDQMGPSQADGQ